MISEKIPASYCFIGAGVEDKTKWRSQHNPYILFNEEVLPQMAAILAQAAMDYLEKHV